LYIQLYPLLSEYTIFVLARESKILYSVNALVNFPRGPKLGNPLNGNARVPAITALHGGSGDS